MKPQTTMNVVQTVFLGIGVIMLVATVFWWMHQRQFVASASHARGTVIELERHHSSSSSSSNSRRSESTTWAPVVRFSTPDGQEHTFVSNSSSNPPAYSRGEEVEVLFQADKPKGATINGWFSLWGGMVIVGAMGLVFTLIGGFMTLIRLRGGQRKKLMRSGRRIEATFQSVEENGVMSVNGRRPFQILCQWQNPQTSKIHVFASENIWYDPTDYIKSETFPVYLEPGNLEHYYMDIASLPKAA